MKRFEELRLIDEFVASGKVRQCRFGEISGAEYNILFGKKKEDIAARSRVAQRRSMVSRAMNKKDNR